MRAALLTLLCAAAPLAAAQEATPPDSSRVDSSRVAAGDSTATPEAIPQRTARFAFPTEGGVFYYRAGPGSAIRRRTPPQEASPTARPAVPLAIPSAAAPQTALAPEAAARPASGVTQRDLDRLENRLLDALDRRLARAERDDRRDVAVVPVAPRGEERRNDTPQAERTVLVPVPVPTPQRPITELPERPVRATPEAPAPSLPPVVTVEEIERDILDTGLFRTTFVNFEFAKANLLPISEQTLDVLIVVLVRYPALRIEVGGHTDNVGTDATNDALSQRRAQSVVNYLAGQGVARQRLTARGYGENQPVATNESETGRALNRRVEFRVLNPEAGERLR